VVSVEGRGASRTDLQRRLLEPVGIAAGEDDIGTLSPSASSCLEPDARAAADHDDGLSGQLRVVLGGDRSPCAGHDSSDGAAESAFGVFPRSRASMYAAGRSKPRT